MNQTVISLLFVPLPDGRIVISVKENRSLINICATPEDTRNGEVFVPLPAAE